MLSKLTTLLLTCAFSLFFSPLGLTAHAAEHEPARVRVAADLLDQTAQSLLPASFELPALPGGAAEDGRPTQASLTEIKYCGGDKGVGRFRAVLRLGDGPSTPAVLGKNSCQAPLAEVAKRVNDTAAALAEVEATWRPWELRLTVTRAEATDKDIKAMLAAALQKPRELLVVPTRDVGFRADAGRIAFHAAPQFHPGGLEIALFNGEGNAPAAPERLASSGHGPSLSGEANVAAEVPLSFANQLFSRLTGSQPLTVPVDRERLELRNVSIGGEGKGDNARVTLTGNATPRSIRETMRWTVAGAGDPLRISTVQMTAAQTEDCSGMGTLAVMGCNLRNGARTAAADTLAATLTQQYQGRPVHQLCSPQTFHFSIADQRFVLVGDVLHTAFAPRGLSASAKLSPPSRD